MVEAALLSAVRIFPGLDGLSGLRVLIVDDYCEGADALFELLVASGAAPHVCYGGADAITAAADLQPDVVILDVVMPGMDGCEVATHIGAASESAPFLIALSGRLDESTRERAVHCGCKLLFAKPVDAGDLLQVLGTIGRILTARRAQCGCEQVTHSRNAP